MISLFVKILSIVLEIIYLPFKTCKTRKKVTFISRQSNNASVDILLLTKAINNMIPECEVVVLTKEIPKGMIGKVSYCFHILEQMYHIATSKVVILDSYCIIISLLHHKKSLKVIQMWHALGLMKKAGYSILGKPEGRSYGLANAMKLHKNYDMILASSESCREAIGEVFGYSVDNVYVAPLPRVDLIRNSQFMNGTKDTILEKYPNLKDKKTILYAPTFRKQEKAMEYELQKFISDFPYEEYNLIFNLHPLSQIVINDERVVSEMPYSTMQLLMVADYVISDYSSIIFEAAIMGKPLLFFAFDFESYQSEREFFIDYQSEVPGPICKNGKELLEAIQNYQWENKKIEAFAEKYVDLSISDCAGRIVRFVENYLD